MIKRKLDDSTDSGTSSNKRILLEKTTLLQIAWDRLSKALSSSAAEKPKTADEIRHFAEMEKIKVIEKFMPFMLRSSVQGAYNMIVMLEAGIQNIIQDFLKMKIPKVGPVRAVATARENGLQGQHKSQSQASQMEYGSVRHNKDVNTDITITINDNLTSIEPPECEDNMEDQNRICIVQVRGHEKQKLEKIESFVLDVSKDIRYHKYGLLGQVPTIARHPESADWRPVPRAELQSNLHNMKGFLKSGEFWPDEYQQIHARLEEVAKLAEEALSNALNRPQDPSCLNDEDCKIWCLATDLDIRECLPSQKESPKFKEDMMKYKMTFFKQFFGYLIDTQWINEEWKKDNDNLLEWIAKMFKTQLISGAGETQKRPEMLRTEALCEIWKLRLNRKDDNSVSDCEKK